MSTTAGRSLVESWDFGDGTTGTGPSITHTYTKPGTFRVTLTATNSSGESNSVTHDAVVKPPELGTTIAFLDADGNVVPSINPDGRQHLPGAGNGVGVAERRRATASRDLRRCPADRDAAGVIDLGQPRPVVPSDLTLAPGGSKVFVYTATVKTAGVFHSRRR